ncbi:MAG: methionine adenosyltransferase [Candidatus Bathyarchaeota archaeon]
MTRVSIEKLGVKPVEEQGVEIVERKGRGHPDYIADATSEKLSRELCKYYLQNFGVILHHNVDKALLVGGNSSPRFGGGEIEEPIYIILAGRAITQAKKGQENIQVPIKSLATNVIKNFLNQNFRFLDVDKHVVTDYKIKSGSVDLVGIFNNGNDIPLANDTSFGVGYAPLTITEKLALGVEKYLNSAKCKKELPEVGEDIKVMALRRGKNIALTISAAMISSLIPDKDHYLNVKEEVCKRVERFASEITSNNLEIYVNTGDNLRSGIYYITVTGTSAERGDDGETGRGNRLNGLITPCRQMSLEAAAGKNPVNHVGKIYNLLAKIIAEKVQAEVKGVRENYVKILSQIGKRINEPLITHVQIVPEKGYSVGNISADIQSIVDEEITNIPTLTDTFINKEVEVY